MSHTPISRSPDLKRLQEDGYEIEVSSGYLLLKHVPYVTSDRTVQFGVLVSVLTLAGDVTARPGTHVAMFVGEMPCDQEGRPLTKIVNSSVLTELAPGLIVNHHFSSKPAAGYTDYYEKMTTYATILSAPAQSIDWTATARPFPASGADSPDPVFLYTDTASSRAGIGTATTKLACNSVAIVGLGGTGSYILDLVAKTPVREIHLFDGDQFLQHNAFRSPGAPSLEALAARQQKAAYFANIYSQMRRNIFIHDHMDDSTADELRRMDFVFVAVDVGRSRKLVLGKLLEFGVPFIDVGMGVLEVDGALLGQLRVTTSAALTSGSVPTTVPLSDGDGEDDYSRNIQIADLNALNAALAVIKWKKLMGFYLDLEDEESSLYQIDGNHLINEREV